MSNNTTIANLGGANGLAASGGSALVGFLQAGTGAVATTAQEKERRTVSAFDYLSDANKAAARAQTITSAAGTAAVQAAINALPSLVGGHVEIEDGVKFDLKALTPPASNRLTMSYRIDDDQSTGLPGSGLASNERVFFSSSSSYPADGTGAIVNEHRYTATFHPGMVVDVRKDLSNLANAGLAPSQSMTNPCRASYNILDEQIGVWRVVYQNFETYTTFSGISQHAWQRKIVLTGVGTSGWGVAPLVTHRVRGSTSGAKGFVRAIDAGTLTLEWFKGAFVVGETLVNETVAATSTNTVSGGTTMQETDCIPMSQSLWNGAITFGDRPPGVGTETVNVSGCVKMVATRGSSSIQPRTVTKPTIKFGTDPESPGFHEMGIQYDPAETFHRLSVVDTVSETHRGQLMPVSAALTFTHSTTVDTNSSNIASIVLYGTGQYQIFYTRNVARGGVMTFATIDGFSGTSVVGWNAQVTTRALDQCFIEIRNSAGVLADIPSGAWASLLVIGGDL